MQPPDTTTRRIEDVFNVNLSVIKTLSLALEQILKNDPSLYGSPTDIAETALARAEHIAHNGLSVKPQTLIEFLAGLVDDDDPRPSAPAGAAIDPNNIACSICGKNSRMDENYDSAFHEGLGWRFGHNAAYCPGCNVKEVKSYATAA